MNHKATLLKADVPNVNGNVYPAEVLRQAVYLFKERLSSTEDDGDIVVPVASLGTYGYPTNPPNLDLADMTHVVQNIEWNEQDKQIEIEINTFDHITQSNDQNVVRRFDLINLDEDLKSGKVKIVPLGQGIVRNSVVSNYELQSTHLVPVENGDQS